MNSIETATVRQIGAEMVSLHGFEQLGFREILEKAGFNKRETGLAILAIVGRLVHPGSDLDTVNRARDISGIDEQGQVSRTWGRTPWLQRLRTSRMDLEPSDIRSRYHPDKRGHPFVP